MRFVCDSCRAQYMISDEKVGAKGVKVRCKKCGYVILVRRPEAVSTRAPEAHMSAPFGASDVPASDSGQHEGSTSSELNPAGKGILDGLADDEIGAVFDQVLSSSGGAAARDPEASAKPEFSSNGQELTRVADPGLLQRLLQSSADAPSQAQTEQAPLADGPKEQDGESFEWFVAIDDKQVGPISFDKVKDCWDRGKIGPDSLCWRSGLADWIPLSDAPELASLLVPKPVKPVIVAAAPLVLTERVSSGSVESAFSAGSTTKPPHAEAAAASAGTAQPAVDGPGGWKPSAASALASLMKEEIEALAKPSPAPNRAVEPVPKPQLLDVPSSPGNGRHGSSTATRAVPDEGAARSSQSARAVPGPVASYPPLYGYEAPRSSRRGLIIGLSIGGGLLVLALAVVTTILVLRSGSSEPASAPSKSSSKTQNIAAGSSSEREKPGGGPVPTNPGPAAPVSNPAPSATAPGTKPADGSSAKSESQATPGKPALAASPGTVETGNPARPERTGSRHERIRPPRGASTEEITVPKKAEKPDIFAKAPVETSEDAFDREFGGGDKRKTVIPKSEQPKKPTSVYVPPAPGGEIAETLGTGDIMQIVVANKPAILKCAAEQKKRDSSLSGKIVMSWTILASGKTTNITCASDEFRSSYMAQCITGLIKTWQFPRHKVQGDPINFPFTF
jgi:predicted Zn finger-like uncharacterized protein